MRKYLIAALAATVAVGGVTASALGQDDTGDSMTVTVKPRDAGTKKKPANSSLRLVIESGNPRAVLTKLAIRIPKTIVVSGKGFPACSKRKLDNTTLDSKGRPRSCRASRVGSGTAQALGGINTSGSFPVTFTVTPIVGGKDRLFFYLHGQNVPVNVVSPGKLKKTKKGTTLKVTVPAEAQNITGLWNGLVKLDTVLKGKKGKHRLVASIGCKSGAHPFSTDLTFGRTFVQNGTDPSTGEPRYGEAPGYKRTVQASSACRK